MQHGTYMKTNYLRFLLLLFLSGCFSFSEKPLREVIDLRESVNIINKLIRNGKINILLDNQDPEQIQALIDNTSPAQLAFESEVLSSTLPTILLYYHTKNSELMSLWEQLAQKFADKVKFILIDGYYFFTLAQDAEIDQFPTILFVKDRKIEKRLVSGSESIIRAQINKWIDEL